MKDLDQVKLLKKLHWMKQNLIICIVMKLRLEVAVLSAEGAQVTARAPTVSEAL